MVRSLSRWIIAIILLHLPMAAMESKVRYNERVCRYIQEVIVGTSEEDSALCAHGIQSIQKHKNYLKNMTFQQFKLLPIFEQAFLKALVVRKEKELLSEFIDMYSRSYPESKDGINFIYVLGKRGSDAGSYTLLDVALTACGVAWEKKESGKHEWEIVELLLEKGGRLKFYPYPHASKRTRMQNNDQNRADDDFPDLLLNISHELPVSLLGFSENKTEPIELDKGVLINFAIND